MEERQRGGCQPVNGRMESVQVLRGMGALFVVCQHICFLQRGSFGVDLFLTVSGFVVMLATEKSAEHFIVKRALRILPLYYAFTLFTFCVLLVKPDLFENTSASAGSLIRSLLFVPFSQDGAVQPLYRVGWTINYEVQFYLLFFIAMKISMRFRALICTGLIGILVLAGALFPGTSAPFVFWTDSILLEFTFGMGLFYVMRAVNGGMRAQKAAGGMRAQKTADDDGCGEKASCADCRAGKNRRYVSCALYVLLTAASAVIFFYEWKSYEIPALCRLPEAVRWGLPSAMLFLLFVSAGRYVRMPRALVRLGDMSFSLYLIHYYPMQFLNRLLRHTTAPGAGEILLTAGTIAAVLALSWLSYRLIEQKLTGYLKRRLMPPREMG